SIPTGNKADRRRDHSRAETRMTAIPSGDVPVRPHSYVGAVERVRRESANRIQTETQIEGPRGSRPSPAGAPAAAMARDTASCSADDPPRAEAGTAVFLCATSAADIRLWGSPGGRPSA